MLRALATLLLVACTADAPAPAPAPLVTMDGRPGGAHAGLERALVALPRYVEAVRRVDDQQPAWARDEAALTMRTAILDGEVIDAVGREGRSALAAALDHAREIATAGGPDHARLAPLQRALARFTAILARRGLAYYVWVDSFVADRPSSPRIVAYRIRGVVHVPRAGREVTILLVARLDGRDELDPYPGYAVPGRDQALVMLPGVDALLRTEIVAGADGTGWFARSHADTGELADWQRAFAAHVRAELGPVAWAARHPRVPGAALAMAFARGRLALAIARHEAQHVVDAGRELPRPAGCARLAGTEARRCAHEVSAHLAQLADEHGMPRVSVAIIAASTLAPACDTADCLAGLTVLDALADRVPGLPRAPLTAGLSYDVRLVAVTALAITELPGEQLRHAAAAAHAALFADAEQRAPTAGFATLPR